MIRAIFLPDTLGSYYLFPQRIVGCELGKNSVRAVVVRAAGHKRMVEMAVEEPLESDTTKAYAERVSHALHKLFAMIGHYDVVHTTVPGNQVVLKELQVPFTSLSKIKLVVPFELEPLLPFPLSEATLDCFITRSDSAGATVLAVAIKNDLLHEHSALFTSAGIQPTRISVDMIDLYGLYMCMQGERAQKNVLLTYLSGDTMRLALVIQGCLKAIRVLAQGTHKLAKLLGQEPEILLRQGVATEEECVQCATFFTDVQFTIQAFSEKLPGGKFDEIVVLGPGVDIVGLPALFERFLAVPTRILTTHSVVQKGVLELKGTTRVPNASLLSLASALPLLEDFNLNTTLVAERDELITKRRLFAGLLLLLLIFGFLVGYIVLALRSFSSEIEGAELETVGLIKKELPTLAKRRDMVGRVSLDALNRAARMEVVREKEIWFALSPQNRASFLMYLQELFTAIDAQGLGLELRRLTLTEESLTLEGRVADYDALKVFNDNLRHMKMFTHVPKLEELTFTAKLVLDKTYRTS